MGCDIHLYREKFVDGKWVTADHWSAYEYGDDKGMEIKYDNRAYKGRNYALFGLLSKGVRREFDCSFEPRGMPLKPCAEVAQDAGEYGEDGHSHSYLYLHELKELQVFMKTATTPVSGMKHRDELKALHDSIASGNPDWNLLYPYCQFTNGKEHVDFQIDVPMAFAVGEGIDQIVASFNGMDGDNHRIVFWFDN